MEEKVSMSGVERRQPTSKLISALQFNATIVEGYRCFVPYIHLGALVLEPKLDLHRIQPDKIAELSPLPLIWVRVIFEEADKSIVQKQNFE